MNTNFLPRLLLSFLALFSWIPLYAAELPVTSNVVVQEPSLVTPSSEKKNAKRLWNLQDADILSVINEVSQETGKNFVVDPRVTGKVTLISSKPLKQADVYQVFLSVIGLLGYSAIPSGAVIRIVPNMESGEMATAVANQRYGGRGDEVMVRVIPLTHISATQMIPILRPLLPQWSNIASYAPGNVLILLGRASNLSRIAKVIQEIDHAANNNIQVIHLHHASANQVATVLNNLQNAARSAGDTAIVSIAVDERTNSVLLGGPKAMRVRINLLISQLDSPSSGPSGNTEVVYLRYLQAKTFAPLLGKIAQNIQGKGGSAQAEMGGAGTSSVSSATVYGNMPGMNMGKMPKGENEETEEAVPINNGFIQAETNTNAVIITAPPALMKALKEVIVKLDIRPAEVLIEAIIAEIDESNMTSLGIQWGTITPGSQQNATSNTAPVVTAFPPYGAGVFGVIPYVHIQAVLSLLRNQNGVDILSTPSVMVLDNQKATIEIGQDVPTQTGSYTTPGNPTTQPFNTTDYKKVTLKLDVTPQINLGASVRLKLKLKNDTLQNPQNPGLTPLINTASIDNSVLINSEDVLVLGGLISNANNENINKVPILGDLPIVGPLLFQQKTSSQQKKNLIVFIKPIIVHNPEEAMMITHTKYNTMRNTQANFIDTLRTIGDERVPTALPPWKNNKDLPKPFEKSP